MIILGIGNVLQKDDGFGVYAAAYLNENYTFSEEISIINGGVEGINLLNVFMDNDKILILDTIQLDDTPASIYAIPSNELAGYGLNSGGAHEIGVLQCLDMLELHGKEVPEATILGIIPSEITFDIALSDTLIDAFDDYIKVALNHLKKHGITSKEKESIISLDEMIQKTKDPSHSHLAF
jgi:hydrogenase maturation protease